MLGIKCNIFFKLDEIEIGILFKWYVIYKYMYIILDIIFEKNYFN